jgi:ABC-type sugar transport system ATPase subunit
MKNISKNFPGVKALKGVDLEVKKGEVHALMGENGAGKSTLIKVLTGVHVEDSGEIYFEGKQIFTNTTLQAQKCGISTIYQELDLIPELSICENVFLGREIMKNGMIDWRATEEKAKAILLDMGIKVDVKGVLSQQSTAIQQMVSIARAISINARLVVMDEPTSSLDEKEVKVLFNVIKKLKAQDISVIFISHRLDEIFEICDAITILKDGERVGYSAIKDITKLQLVSMMIGRDASKIVSRKKSYSKDKMSNENIIETRNIVREPKVRGIDIEVKKGEVLGLAGLLGAGRTELARLIFGADAPQSGDIYINGKKVKLNLPKDAIKAGLGFCPEDRKVEGIIPHMSVKENITLAMLPRLTKMGVVSKKEQEKIVNKYIEALKIKTPHMNQAVRNLSGGNQQKVILARWLCMNPELLILDEPTRGIDVGAKTEILDLIEKLAEDNISVLMVSSEIEELMHACDRIAVIRDGKKAGELYAEEIGEEAIMNSIAEGGK